MCYGKRMNAFHFLLLAHSVHHLYHVVPLPVPLSPSPPSSPSLPLLPLLSSLSLSLSSLSPLSSLFLSLPSLTRCHLHSISLSGTPILLSEGDPDLTVAETHNLTLTCLVAVEQDAVHSPKLAWYHDDADLLEDGDLVTFEHTFLSNQTIETEDQKNMHKFTLTLVNVARHRAGVYECRLFHRIDISHSRAVFNITVHCESLVHVTTQV